ncbi:MAG: D-tyrosyl-tRNA(Tyr) deacylase [Actinobacteria bacterium]|nr:D-tyrosyl-tRNA(Tyr) deacylase [Actinomycetota bacterium]
MRLVLQRVSRAAVRVGGAPVAEIGRGVVALVGVGRTDRDRPGDAERWLAGKVAGLRIFEDDEGRMNRSLLDVEGAVLVVPQFTLYGDARRGRRPSWAAAAPPEEAEGSVERFAVALESMGVAVQRGAFREHMEVELVNDGPVTILLEDRFSAAPEDPAAGPHGGR